jgi:hypothetical protein
VLVCTPTRGNVSPQYATSLLGLTCLSDVDVLHGFDLLDARLWSDDLVRVRSRFVRAFLETDATHLLFVDGDVVVRPETVLGMLYADRPFVAAPYPRRGVVDFPAIVEALQEGDARKVEAHAYDYALRWLPDTTEIKLDERRCMAVASVPLGCALISRELLERMVQHYGERMVQHYGAIDRERVTAHLPEPSSLTREALFLIIRNMALELEAWRSGHMGLTFQDVPPGGPRELVETVALFQLMNRDGALFSEDVSFCQRVRDMGESVWLYLGKGSPVDHVGEHTFTGEPQAFGIGVPPAGKTEAA